MFSNVSHLVTFSLLIFSIRLIEEITNILLNQFMYMKHFILARHSTILAPQKVNTGVRWKY